MALYILFNQRLAYLGFLLITTTLVTCSFEFAGSCRTNEVNDCKNLIKTLVMRAESWQNYPLTLVILYLKINMFFFLICVQE